MPAAIHAGTAQSGEHTLNRFQKVLEHFDMFRVLASAKSVTSRTATLLHTTSPLPRFRRWASNAAYQAPVSSPIAIAGGAGVMVGTYFLLDTLFNTRKPLIAVGNTMLPTASSYLAGTYKYVASGLGITAASAVVAYRTGFAARLLRANPFMLFAGSLACTMGGMMLATSTPSENALAKHAFWALTCSSVGILSMSSLGFLPQQLLMQAGLYTLGIVGSLSVVAINAEHDAFLYIGGPLMMGLGVVVLASVTSAFSRRGGMISRVSNSISLYGGLGVFSLFMLYDTQRIMMKGRLSMRPQLDYINESFGIYWNILNIFIRMVHILGGSRRK